MMTNSAPRRPSKSLQFLQTFNWMVLERTEVKVGDLYANGATITEIVHGGQPTLTTSWGDGLVDPGKIKFVCGDSMTTTADSDAAVIIGRRFDR